MEKDGELLFPCVEGEKCVACKKKIGESGTVYQNLKIDGEAERTYKRFTVLPNFNGQKYTLGNRVTCREEQGEFIFLSGNLKHAIGNGGNHGCVIKVRDNKYFVTPVEGGLGIFVNNIPVLKKTELRFGDSLFLGEKKRTFLFKERELNPEALFSSWSAAKKEIGTEKDILANENTKSEEILSSSAEFIPGQNGLILSNILSHLSITELKNCRFISKIWNEECFKILKKRCTIYLGLQGCAICCDSNMQLFRYSVEMLENPLPNWTIEVPSFLTFDRTRLHGYDRQQWVKRRKNFNWFLILGQIHPVKKLKLEGCFITYKEEYKHCLRLLIRLQSTLQELHFSGSWDFSEDTGTQYRFPPCITFPKLQSFVLSVEIGEILTDGKYPWDRIYEYNLDSFIKFWNNLIPAIKNVTKIKLGSKSRSLSPTFLGHIVKQSDLFVNLSEISFDSVFPDVIRTLLELQIPLKKLELGSLESMKSEDFRELEQLLLKHSQTLKSLQLLIFSLRNPEGGEEKDHPFLIVPSFPVLEALNFGWEMDYYWDDESEDESDDESDDEEEIPTTWDVNLVFPNEEVNYARDFPSLKSLTLGPREFQKYSELETNSDFPCIVENEWTTCGPFYETFFPTIKSQTNVENRGEICKTLQVLNIMTHVYTTDGIRPLFKKHAIAAIAAMFPNVSNPEWTVDKYREF